jgi:DNA (cytosine-5)-methyltransferase 1
VRPKLLDLFCKAGGASMGYHRAGFCVTGVDIESQKNYPFEFIQADCMDLDIDFLRQFDAIHASPPCQAHSDLKHMWNAKQHKDLIVPTRHLLLKTRKPFVIENVEGSPLINPIKLCGTMFGLKTVGAELRRHRLFEINWSLFMVPPCHHGKEPRVIGVYGGHGRDRRRTINTQDFPTSARCEAMGIDWMTGSELSQAIPPAYTEWIGKYLIEALKSP